MATVLKIIDEYFGSDAPGRRSGGELHLVSERMTPREIIRRRVENEVAELNNQRRMKAGATASTRSFLVDSGSSPPELLLNAKRSPKGPLALLDAESETDRALTAFGKRAFILLVDDRQVEDPDAAVTVGQGSEVVFLYLTPLKGG